jgi:hypothetical protein
VQAACAGMPGFSDDSLGAGHGRRQIREVPLNVKYLKGYISDTKAIAVSPLSWRPSDFLSLSLAVCAALTLADEDRDIQAWVQSNRSDDSNMVADLARPIGDGKYALPALGVLYCYGRFTGNDRVRRTALLSLESIAVSGAITGAVKYVTHKQRPACPDL